jgi:Protein of unknown function (DUF3079)
MKKKFPVHPANPERLCWGCDQYCPATSMNCGNGSDRTQHPVELFGEDWQAWGGDFSADAGPDPAAVAGDNNSVATAAPDFVPHQTLKEIL